MDLTRFIPTGKESAISTQELLSIANVSERTLRDMIRDKRLDGELICSTTSGGYYFAASRSELREYYKMAFSRAVEAIRALTPFRKALATIEGQEELILEEIKNKLHGDTD